MARTYTDTIKEHQNNVQAVEIMFQHALNSQVWEDYKRALAFSQGLIAGYTSAHLSQYAENIKSVQAIYTCIWCETCEKKED